MQLNTLGVPALVNNPIYNIVNQLGLRLPVSIVNTVLDKSIKSAARLIGKDFAIETDVLKSQKEFFNKLGLGTNESLGQVITGLSRLDYTQKEIFIDGINPKQSLKDLYSWSQGKKSLSKTQILDKSLKASFGIPAEAVARILNLGDKPMRFAAEGAQASVFANNLGLKGIDYKLFVEFPREEAYRIYKEKGLSDEKAGLKADYISDTIVKEGARSTFQQDNWINDKINNLLDGKNSGVGQLIGAVAISPYKKIPLNVLWSFYNFKNPEVALLQSVVYGIKAYKAKDIVDNTAAKNLHEARYWLAHAAVGMATRGVIASLVSAGIFNTANTEKDTKKEREGELAYEDQGTVNITKLRAWLKGEDPSKIKNGLLVKNKWFGLYGALGNSMASDYEKATTKQQDAKDEYFNSILNNLSKEGIEGLQQGVFANTSALLNSFKSEGGMRRYYINTINMFANIIQPATLAQLSRAELPYYTKAKAESFYEEVKNSMLTRSPMLRSLTGQMPPSKINIWGQEMKTKDNVAMRYFGVSSYNKDNFAQPLYEDYKRTNNTDFLPPAVMPTIKSGNKNFKLTPKEATKLEIYVGKGRKSLIEKYINNMAEFEGDNKVYSELTDEEKVDRLRILYSEGYTYGKERFLEEFPKYINEKTEEEIEKEKDENKYNEQIRKSAKEELEQELGL
jgi:hypothetical protein